jgi:hypothetical protein
MQPQFTDMNELNHTKCDSRSCPTLPINRCISYPIVKVLAQESEKESEKEPSKTYDWISIIYNTFFSTGHETNKQKET